MAWEDIMRETLSHLTISAACLVSAWATPAQAKDTGPLAIRASDPTLKWGACPPIFPGRCEIAILQGDPSRPNADALLRIGGGYELPLHRHTSAERMVLIEGRLQVTYEGSSSADLTPGTYAYGPAGLAHRGKCLSRAPCVLFIAFEGPVDAEPVAVAR